MPAYEFALVVLGVCIVAAAVLPRLLASAPISLPIVYVVLGIVLFALPGPLQGPQPTSGEAVSAAERMTELVVIISLMGAGLKLRRPVGWRSWQSTWRLLGVAMPITIAGVAVLGVAALGLPVAAAILLGAVLAPTDPVLASEVQLAGPGGEDEAVDEADPAETDDEVRFALTSEAGLNDGLAFPFTNLAIAMAAGGSWFVGWVVEDVVVRLGVGLVTGVVLGWIIAYLSFGLPERLQIARSGQGFVSLGATLVVYGVTEAVHGYGFLAVFVAAVVLRRSERDHEYHQALHEFAETLEQLASVVFLLLLGGAVADGALSGLTPIGFVVAVVVVLVLRPASGMLALVGAPGSRAERWAISFFGIRGMGTVFYLAYAVTEERFPNARLIWAVAITVILISILLHGVTAGHILDRVDRARAG